MPLVFSASALAMDTDSDGIEDTIEQTITGTDYRDPDTDNDGLLDGAEDLDRDGVRDVMETSPKDADSDDDGLSDGEEDLDNDGVFDITETHPLDSDSDDDFLNDGLEKGRTTAIGSGISSPGGIAYFGTYITWIPDADSATTTDPRDTDTDNDNLPDGYEDQNHNGRVDAGESNPNVDDDADNDGYYSEASGGTDCDDTNPNINPAGTEIACNGVDEDCDGMDAGEDNDWDGHCSIASGGDDCDDTNSAIHPGATEIWYDDIDQDCAGDNDYDRDKDGYVSDAYPGQAGGTAPNPGDCDDTNSSIHPGAVEIAWDGIDSNCDGMEAPDNDKDGYDSTVDCNDFDPEINPAAVDIACNGVDEDCDGMDGGEDNDRDGHCSIASGGDDCDDTHPEIHPGVTEVWYDDIDQDCDGWNDYDMDKDGYVEQAWSHKAGGTAPNTGDCDDTNAEVYPGAEEIVGDGLDNDCDGLACEYKLIGDLDADCEVDLEDLAALAANWLINCFDDPENPACVHPE